MMQRIQIAGVEINAVMHCNLACVGCSHASPVALPSAADPTTVRRDLDALARVADISEVRVVGGEPLLHPDLDRLVAEVRLAQPGWTVRVITNGTRLHRTDWQWLEHVDEVYLSQYPAAAIRRDALEELRRRADDLGVEVGVNNISHFRLVHPGRALSDVEARAVFETCQVAHAWSCHTVHEGYLYRCPMVVSSWRPASDESRCALAPHNGLADRIDRLLSRRNPLTECANCLGTVGTLVPHTNANRKSWLPLSTIGEIDWAHVAAVRADPHADYGCANLT